MIRLQRLRKRAGLSQRELAALVGVAEITVRKWETGKRAPRLMRIKELAKALKCAPAQLL
jgi:transcriptional regulator with XRE-family HTH domain